MTDAAALSGRVDSLYAESFVDAAVVCAIADLPSSVWSQTLLGLLRWLRVAALLQDLPPLTLAGAAALVGDAETLDRFVRPAFLADSSASELPCSTLRAWYEDELLCLSPSHRDQLFAALRQAAACPVMLRLRRPSALAVELQAPAGFVRFGERLASWECFDTSSLPSVPAAAARAALIACGRRCWLDAPVTPSPSSRSTRAGVGVLRPDPAFKPFLRPLVATEAAALIAERSVAEFSRERLRRRGDPSLDSEPILVPDRLADLASRFFVLGIDLLAAAGPRSVLAHQRVVRGSLAELIRSSPALPSDSTPPC